MKKNIFIEGMQGTGKSTLLRELSKHLSGYNAYYEGDLSPVELAWCSYMTKDEFEATVSLYETWSSELEHFSMTEPDGHVVVAYTRILTEMPAFYQFMEGYEIYNGRVDFDTFRNIIQKRFSSFVGEGNLFECSFFQNSIESMILYYQMEDDEIVSFYQESYEILKEKGFRLLYLDSDRIRENILQIKKERTDNQGNELWFSLMLNYLKESPYGKAHGYQDLEDMIEHFSHRRKLETRIINEVIKGDCLVLTAKDYKLEEVLKYLGEDGASHANPEGCLFRG